MPNDRARTISFQWAVLQEVWTADVCVTVVTTDAGEVTATTGEVTTTRTVVTETRTSSNVGGDLQQSSSNYNNSSINGTTSLRATAAVVNSPTAATLPLIAQITRNVYFIFNYGIAPVAFVLNGLSFIVFIRMMLRKQQIMVVFVAISIVDTWSLMPYFDTLLRNISGSKSLLNYQALCKIFYWIEEASQFCSGYFALLYTAERFVCVKFPLRRAVIWTKRRTHIAIMTIVSVALGLEAHNLYFYTEFGGVTCIVLSNVSLTYARVRLVIHFVFGQMVPYLGVAILNALIVKEMIAHRRKRASLGANVASDAEERAQRSMTLMLVVVSTYSIVVSFPRLVAVGMNPLISSNASSDTLWFYSWANNVISPLNYCANFFFYVLSGRQFRAELLRTFCCRQIPSGGLGPTTRMSALSQSDASIATTTSEIAMKMKDRSGGKAN